MRFTLKITFVLRACIFMHKIMHRMKSTIFFLDILNDFFIFVDWILEQQLYLGLRHEFSNWIAKYFIQFRNYWSKHENIFGILDTRNSWIFNQIWVNFKLNVNQFFENSNRDFNIWRITAYGHMLMNICEILQDFKIIEFDFWGSRFSWGS